MKQQPKAILRLLLRAVDKHITSVAGNQQWRQHVLQQFRQAKDADAGQQQRLLLIAQEYADLINNIAHHQALLETYNIGVDPETRNKQMVEKTAARVGFRLPDDQPDSTADTQQQQPQDQQQQLQQERLQQFSSSSENSSITGSSSSSSSGSGSSNSSREVSDSGTLQQHQHSAAAAAVAAV